MSTEYMSHREWLVWHAAFEEILRVLAKAQERREALRGYIGDDDEWVIYERDEAYRITNAIRARNDMRPALMSQIRAAENLACGHSDYTKKFALGCADLTTKESA